MAHRDDFAAFSPVAELMQLQTRVKGEAEVTTTIVGEGEGDREGSAKEAQSEHNARLAHGNATGSRVEARGSLSTREAAVLVRTASASSDMSTRITCGT